MFQFFLFSKLEYLCTLLKTSNVALIDKLLTCGLYTSGMLNSTRGKQCPLLDSEHYFLQSLAGGSKSVGGFYCNFFMVDGQVVARHINFGLLALFGVSLSNLFSVKINWCPLFTESDIKSHQKPSIKRSHAFLAKTIKDKINLIVCNHLTLTILEYFCAFKMWWK